MGFQGNDPATDFRGMGILGLENNIYFAFHFNDEMIGILEQERQYPFCVAGKKEIN
jgi:ELMO domain-containing protein